MKIQCGVCKEFFELPEEARRSMMIRAFSVRDDSKHQEIPNAFISEKPDLQKYHVCKIEINK
jgi:hypothetical protein